MFRFKHIMVLPVTVALFALGMVGSVNAQTASNVPMVAIQLLSSGLTANAGPGSNNATLAVVRLDTTYSTDDIRISSLPLILSTSNNASAANLSNCVVTNSGTGLMLNSGANVGSSIVNGLNNMTLDTPLVLPRGTVTTLNVNCNIASSAALGGAFQFSLNTANVAATAVSTGLPALVTVGNSAPVTTPIGTVGFPNTGAGGQAAENIALILGSLLAAAVGVVYARRAAR